MNRLWRLGVVLLAAGQHAAHSGRVPVVPADARPEHVNAQVDALIATGVLRRVLALTVLRFSNAMIEASWHSLKHQWLLLRPLERTRQPEGSP